jgi:hypothetical protein
MIRSEPEHSRHLHSQQISADLAVVGGGLSGICCAISAARAGIKVVLIHDRPVLGGNASSEVRLWILGATSHMGNNNRWAREGGVIDEILVENTYRNPEGNPLILDALLIEKVRNEPGISLLLNTAVFELAKSDSETISSVRAFCPQNSTLYDISAPLFCDSSGDGIVGYLSGAAFRVGAESRAEFGEKFAPHAPTTDVLGHTIYFYSKETGRPVRFIAPDFALKDITRIPRYRHFNARDYGCRLWWIEWGGELDTVHESEDIKWELWKVAYGVWNYIKNSGKFPEASTLSLEWFGTIPGKRESRRFEGPYLLTQMDVVEQRQHEDAVAFGGWAIDVHPPDGVYNRESGCSQWHSKGVYQIPYRCYFSRNISNLFFAGRNISASHVAFASTRVMATCACGAQAVGTAAALCIQRSLKPKQLCERSNMDELQTALLRAGNYIPGVALNDSADLAREATLSASSELKLSALSPNGETLPLSCSWAMMLPVKHGPMPCVQVTLDVAKHTTLRVELRVSSKHDNHTPDVTIAILEIPLKAGREQVVDLSFDALINRPRYAFVCLCANEAISVHLSEQRVTGILALAHKANHAVAKCASQQPPPDAGIEGFEFWTPQRRPGGKNFALQISPPIEAFGAANLRNGFARPTHQPNAWVASFADDQPSLKLTWPAPRLIGRIELAFDTDFDHPMESVLMGHPESVMPFCVEQFQIKDGAGGVLVSCHDNHQTRRSFRLENPVTTDCLYISLTRPNGMVPAALFEVRCYEQ